jgi:hypothetical protein
LYESRLAQDATPEEVASHRKALGIPDKPDEYKALIRKSLDLGGKLSPAENARLTEMSGALVSTKIWSTRPNKPIPTTLPPSSISSKPSSARSS